MFVGKYFIRRNMLRWAEEKKKLYIVIKRTSLRCHCMDE